MASKVIKIFFLTPVPAIKLFDTEFSWYIMASKKKSADPAVEDAPVLEIDDALFSSPADPVHVVPGAAVHMKLPTFWPDAAEV